MCDVGEGYYVLVELTIDKAKDKDVTVDVDVDAAHRSGGGGENKDFLRLNWHSPHVTEISQKTHSQKRRTPDHFPNHYAHQSAPAWHLLQLSVIAIARLQININTQHRQHLLEWEFVQVPRNENEKYNGREKTASTASPRLCQIPEEFWILISNKSCTNIYYFCIFLFVSETTMTTTTSPFGSFCYQYQHQVPGSLLLQLNQQLLRRIGWQSNRTSKFLIYLKALLV